MRESSIRNTLYTQDAHLCQRQQLSKRDSEVPQTAYLQPQPRLYATEFKGVLPQRRGWVRARRRVCDVPPGDRPMNKPEMTESGPPISSLLRQGNLARRVTCALAE